MSTGTFYYPEEQLRGYDALEDLIKTGLLQARVPAGHSEFTLVFDYFGGSEAPDEMTRQPFTDFSNRLQQLSDSYHDDNSVPRTPLTEMLVRQTDQFILSTAAGPR